MSGAGGNDNVIPVDFAAGPSTPQVERDTLRQQRVYDREEQKINARNERIDTDALHLRQELQRKNKLYQESLLDQPSDTE